MKSKTVFVLVILSFLTILISNSTVGQDSSTINKLEQPNQKLLQQQTNKIEVNIDKDLMTFVKTTFWIAGVFLAVISFIGIAFFGFDVRNASKHLSEIRKELDKKSGLLKDLFEDVKEGKQTLERNRVEFEKYITQAQEKVEQLGAEIEGLITLKDETFTDKVSTTSKLISKNSDSQDDISLLKEIISTSSFEWTSLKRIIAKSGLDRDTILKTARKDPEIIISIGSKSKDHIFKLKK